MTCPGCSAETQSAVVLVTGDGETAPMAMCPDCLADATAGAAFLKMAFDGMIAGGVSRKMANDILISHIHAVAA
jgi:hypothetical protein